jgi:hypothetical protein
MDPVTESCSVVLHAQQHGACSVDEHASQVEVATLADAVELGLASGGMLAGNQAEPGGEVASFAEGSAVANGGHGCRGYQRADAGDLAQLLAGFIFGRDALDLFADGSDVDLQLFPLLLDLGQQVAHARGEVLVGVFQDRGHVLA